MVVVIQGLIILVCGAFEHALAGPWTRWSAAAARAAVAR